MFGRARFRRYFLTGLVVLAPVGVTAWILMWAFQTLDGIVGEPLRQRTGFWVPGLGVVVLGVMILLIGWIVHQAAGRQLLSWWNHALARFPLTGAIYNALSQIVQTVVGEQRRLFRRAVLIPYPTSRMWVVAFVTNEDPARLSDAVRHRCINVFVPTTPNPTSGFMLLVPLEDAIALDLSVEEAMKLVISAGAVTPQEVSQTTGRRGLDLDHLLRDDRRG